MIIKDDMLLAAIDDKRAQCEERCKMTHTGFLDMRQAAEAAGFLRGCTNVLLWGGYDDAERRICVFLPEYMTAEDAKDGGDCPLRVLRVTLPKNGGGSLSHRDYLGALLALGVDRSVAGDILVRKDGADIIVLESMADYLQRNYSGAGRTVFAKTEILPVGRLDRGSQESFEKRDTVASLRLDGLVASAFNLSRGKAQEAIRQGLVAVDSFPAEKPDMNVAEGSRLVLRGMGKAVLTTVGGTTRKDRITVVWTKFK